MASTQEIAARLMADLQRDYDLSPAQAAGVVGNLMHESGGFNSLQEINPTVPGSRGGYGYAQWTGPRRNAFEDYAQSNNLDPTSYEANYGFLQHELATDPYERNQFMTVKRAQTAEDAARLISENYLRPGIPHMDSRINYANSALGYAPQELPKIDPPALAAINRAAPSPMSATGRPSAPAPAAAPPRGGILSAAWSGINQGIGGLQGMMAQPGGIMGAAKPPMQDFGKSMMSFAMGSPAVRTAVVKSLMNQNIGKAPTVTQGHVPGGSQVMAVNRNGSSPVTLMGATNPGSRAYEANTHPDQDMNVYRANRAAVGDRITQASIDKALSGGSTLYRR